MTSVYIIGSKQKIWFNNFAAIFLSPLLRGVAEGRSVFLITF